MNKKRELKKMRVNLAEFVNFLMGIRFENPEIRTNRHRLEALGFEDVTDVSSISGKTIYFSRKQEQFVVYDPKTDTIINVYEPKNKQLQVDFQA